MTRESVRDLRHASEQCRWTTHREIFGRAVPRY